MSDTSCQSIIDLGFHSLTDELPEGWHVMGGVARSHGVVENSFGQKFEFIEYGYIHESGTAEVRIKPDRTTILKRRPAVILEMQLRLMIETFKDRRLFDNFRKAKDWAIFFMKRYHESGLYNYDTSHTTKNGDAE